VTSERPYTLAEQLSWTALPALMTLVADAAEETPADVARMTGIAQAGQGGPASPPWSAAHPYVNLFSPASPATATVSGNLRLTGDDASADIRHIVLDFGQTAFPVLEGQSIGIIPAGADDKGHPHAMRLYSVASPRDGERPGYNNLALTVKRVIEDHHGQAARGLCSNYLCDLAKGDTVRVCGPYGSSFLMPNHPGSSIMMICTGTGSAPMRAMTERRRRRLGRKEGGELALFFGARAPTELPYFGPLTKLPKDLIDINFAFSRIAEQPKQYVQNKLRERHQDVFRLLQDDNCFIYLCGLKGMEAGVAEAFRDICRRHGADWDKLKPALLAQGRLHIETY
jgi:benzoyl-CoA 2,3-dioxygenase component A